MTPEKTARLGTKTIQYVVAIALVVAIAGSATYAVMSDTSIHGLTVRFYNVSRYCPNPTTAVLTFNFYQVVVYSSASIETSLSQVHFTMSADGVLVGSVSAQDSKFGPGQSVSYSLTFSNSTLDPHSQPLKSNIFLGITALVSAGLYSSTTTASDSELVTFSGPPC
ncbi:hypothetical protein AUI46_03035 [archaeon 13_1_40CM_2_52_13]|nr:MAG: hypothetical protein AUI46_03035 [archaeon 13_1_40CM_2_52_13]TMI41586.1 MAG: hypothetical protein E6H21_01925 [Candidatus Bathyarchaeota archaeon]